MDCDFNYHGPVVVFDLDDTLFRERDFCRSGFNIIEKILIKEKGIKYIGISKRLDSLLRRRENYFGWLETILGAEVSHLVELYRTHNPESLKMMKDVKPVIENLSERGVVMAIITDGRSKTQRRKIEALGLPRYIIQDNILISEETGHDKTSPENFRVIVRRYPEAGKFVYVGDNVRKDFMIPNMMGWETFQVPADYDSVHTAPSDIDDIFLPKKKLSLFKDLLLEI